MSQRKIKLGQEPPPHPGKMKQIFLSTNTNYICVSSKKKFQAFNVWGTRVFPNLDTQYLRDILKNSAAVSIEDAVFRKNESFIPTNLKICSLPQFHFLQILFSTRAIFTLLQTNTYTVLDQRMQFDWYLGFSESCTCIFVSNKFPQSHS